MPTKRTFRERQEVAFPSAYQTSELLTGEISYPVRSYTGYGDGIGTDLHDFISDRMIDDWLTHRDALLAFWISEAFSSSQHLPNTLPWLFYCGAPGSRPWAWWYLEQRELWDDGETDADYISRLRLWLPGEREAFYQGTKKRVGAH
jgi:hypothetical protein